MNKYMKLAFKEAEKALKTDDVPVGAVIVEKGKILAKAHNTKEKKQMVTRHAEINAIEKACQKKHCWYLNDCVMYITSEPCKMCMGAIEQARIKKIIYATKREKKVNNIFPQITQGEGENEARNLLKSFFENKRK